MERRKFLTGSGMVAGAIAGLVLGYRQYNNKPVVDKKVLDEVDASSMSLQLTHGYGPKKNPVHPVHEFDEDDPNRFYIISPTAVSYDKMVTVAIKPGPDGNLYIKTNNEWKQVLTS
jgi:hypothetical protein